MRFSRGFFETHSVFSDAKLHPDDWSDLPAGIAENKIRLETIYLVGGFNPFEIYSSNWIISPGFRGENKKSLKPPPSNLCFDFLFQKLPLKLSGGSVKGPFHPNFNGTYSGLNAFERV